MFSFSIPTVIRSSYTVFSESLHVYYDQERQFGATLDILVDPKLDKELQDAKSPIDFISLTFSYHGKSSKSQTLLFSIIKVNHDKIMVKVTDNEVTPKFHEFYVTNKSLIEDITKAIENTSTLRTKCDKYLSNDYIINQCKRLLENFSLAVKPLLETPEPENILMRVIMNVINLINSDGDEFRKIIDLNSTDSVVSKASI